MYTVQRNSGELKPILTVTTSKFDGDETTEHGTDASTAISTPPPQEPLSLRKIEKFPGRISKSDTDSDSQVSVMQYIV
jgi:hypothetical protein